MRFEPGSPVAGDIVRVKLGSIYHYGIFTPEGTVIQFGYPPIARYADKEKVVTETDMEVFCCGMIPERGVPERGEKRKYFSAEKTVGNARSRLGEGGYDLIYNNCEHFAYECSSGEKYCSAVDDARKRWASRPLYEIYLTDINNPSLGRTFASERRMKYIESTAEDTLYKKRCASWTLLEGAMKKTLHTDPASVIFKRRRDGKWLCKDFFFSISYSGNFAAIAVSNKECGIDIASVACEANYAQSEIRCPGEEGDFTELYTKKESIYKCSRRGRFLPGKIKVSDYPVRTVKPEGLGIILSFCGENSPEANLFLVEEGLVPKLLKI